MRKIKYGNRPVSVAEIEEPLKRRRFNWDRMVYFGILVLVVGSLIFYLVKNFCFVSAPGQVVKESYLVLFPYDIRLEDIIVQEDDSVVIGQPLLKLARDFRLADRDLVSTTRSVDEWIARERFAALRNISIKTIEAAENLKTIEHYKTAIERIGLLVILDAGSSSKIEDHKLSIAKLEVDSNILNEETRYWRTYLGQLPEYRKDYESRLLKQLSEGSSLIEFVSPINGRIADIKHRSFDLVYKGEPILNIEQEEAYIKAYIPQKEFSSVYEGDEVTVIFPDKSKGKGIVSKIYTQLERLPPEYQDETGPRIRSFLAIVKPRDTEQMKKWKMNNKLSVEIRKSRFF